MMYRAALEKHGSIRKAADALGVARTTFYDNVRREQARVDAIRNLSNTEKKSLKRSDEVVRYIFTAAVKGARVHEDFLKNLEVYAEHVGAELIIGPLTNINRLRYDEVDDEEFSPLVVSYLKDTPLIVDNKVRFSPELKLAATMVKPLQGLQTYTKRLWGIFPHTKISMESVPTHKDRPTKFITTTGAVTHPNYSSTKAGFRAHFDHVHGALILEVDKRGVWMRHLTPADEDDGTFYDLSNKVSHGRVKEYGGVDALVFGDIHVEEIDRPVLLATWAGPNSLVDKLSPSRQVFHDLMDMSFANYHELDDMFKRLKGIKKAGESFDTVSDFLTLVSTHSDECVIVDSNHDYFIDKWLRKFDPEKTGDFENVIEYYELKLAMVKAAISNDPKSILRLTLEAADALPDADNITFLSPDESYEVQDIECGWHGHRGPNGRRGSKTAFKFVTEKSIVGHLHSPSIESGCYVVGTSSKLDLGYNQGPSSWAHTHCIIYPHGGRTLVTLSDGRFWVDQ